MKEEKTRSIVSTESQQRFPADHFPSTHEIRSVDTVESCSKEDSLSAAEMSDRTWYMELDSNFDMQLEVEKGIAVVDAVVDLWELLFSRPLDIHQ